MRAIAEGEIDVTPMITGTCGVDGVPAAFDALGDPEEHVKILVEPGGPATPRPILTIGRLRSRAHPAAPSSAERADWPQHFDHGGCRMGWDFSTEPAFQEKLDWVEQFCREEVEPLEYVFPYAVRSHDPKIKALVKGLQDQVRAQGLWPIFLDEDLGGPGYGQLKLGLLNEILGRYPSAPQMFGAAAPDTGNMEMLAAYGTDEQKQRWLEPMLNQEMWSAYSMTEPQGGSDPNLFRTHAERDGEEWVINGEKWFTSAGRVADILFVMCTNGMFVVPRTTPGVEIMPEPATTTTSSTPTCEYRSIICSDPKTGPRSSRTSPRRRSHPSRDAHHRAVQVGLRHDVRTGVEPRVARQDHRRAPDGAGEDRRLLRRDPDAAAVRARNRVEDRQHEHARDAVPTSRR